MNEARVASALRTIEDYKSRDEWMCPTQEAAVVADALKELLAAKLDRQIKAAHAILNQGGECSTGLSCLDCPRICMDVPAGLTFSESRPLKIAAAREFLIAHGASV